MSKNMTPVMALRNTNIFPGNVVPLAVGRPQSLKGVTHLTESDDPDPSMAFFAQGDKDKDNPDMSDLYPVGTRAKILRVVRLADDNLNVIVQGVERVRLVDLDDSKGYLMGEVEPFPLHVEGDSEEDTLHQSLKDLAIDVVSQTQDAPKETSQILSEIESAEDLCYFIAGNLDIQVYERQEILSQETLKGLLAKTIEKVNMQLQASKMAARVQENMRKETDKAQREFYIRQQIKALRSELGDSDNVLEALEKRVHDSNLPDEVRDVCLKQIDRLSGMQTSSSEYSVTLNYVETLLDVPWLDSSQDNLDLNNAQDTLDEDHYGLEKVKNRVIEYLAVRKLKNDMKGPILCLVGPPGVGKTSMGRSIADALGREFVRISLGGVHDESEIRGHRRTYVGAMPGRIAKAMIKAGTNNPVVMLDEIDKIGKDHRGDPQAAMLEVLDPAQNHAFSDHYLEIPLDLSNVMFIATANQLSTISGPLRDRMEIIEVPSYTRLDKLQIAKRHLVPKQVDNHGITDENITFQDDALEYVINYYTKEAGVRNLERRIADLCRSVAVEVAKDMEADVSVTCTPDYVSDKLGPERYLSEVTQRVSVPGVATGLAWTQVGGDVLFVEVSKMPGEGKLKLTGQLGDVMRESAQAALTFLKSNASDFGLDYQVFDKHDLHIHFPAGAVPKDGPSAGVTIFSAILSTFTNIKVRQDVAMTGEITLRGTVLPVGGIKEKLTAAHRAGIKRILIPELCRKDLRDLPEEVKNDLDIHFLERVEQLPALALEDPLPKLVKVEGDSDSRASGRH